jgi:superkiller protein 3
MNAGELTQAFLIAERLERAYPHAAGTHVLRGRLELARLSFEAAGAALERAVRIDARNAAAHLYLGIALRRLGQDDKALERFEMAKKLDPANGEAWLESGRLRAERGELEEAARELQSAVRLRPQAAPAYNLLAQTLRKLGRPEEAAVFAAKFLELSRAARP